MIDPKTVDSASVVCIGTNGTGKSTWLKEILKSAYGKKRVIIFPSNPSEPSFKNVEPKTIEQVLANPNWQGACRVQLYDENDFERIVPALHNCIVISDDFRNYIPNTRLKRNFRRLLIERRHRKVDIFLACHGFTHMPPELVQFTTFFVVFRTIDNPMRHRDKFTHPKAFFESVERINEISNQPKNAHYHEIILNE